MPTGGAKRLGRARAPVTVTESPSPIRKPSFSQSAGVGVPEVAGVAAAAVSVGGADPAMMAEMARRLTNDLKRLAPPM